MSRSFVFAIVLAAIPGAIAAQNATPSAVMKTYCVSCHSGPASKGGVPLDRIDADNPAKDSQSPEASADSATAVKRLRIEVTGGEKNVAVESASVYLKYVEEKKLFKDRKYALNVKTNRSGVAHIPDPPMGKVLIQIVADGWKTYGKYYELTDPGEVIKIHLDRPPKWY